MIKPELRRASARPRQSRKRLLATAMTLAVLAASAQAEITPHSTEYWDGGIALGYGWDSMRGAPALNTCIEFKPTRAGASPEGQVVNYVSTRVVDRYSLMKSINMSVNAQKKMLGVFGGSASASQMTTARVESSGLAFVLHAYVENPTESIEAPDDGGGLRLKDQFAKLAGDDLPGFRKTCGDSFVYAKRPRAEIYSLLTNNSLTVEESVSSNVDLKVQGLVYSAGGSVDQKSVESRLREKSTFSFLRKGGSGTPIPTSEAELLAAIRTLPETAAAPVTSQMEIVSYSSLANAPPSLTEPAVRSPFLTALYFYNRFDSLYLQFEEAAGNPGSYIFDTYSESDIQQVRDQLLELVRTLADLVRRCAAESDSPECDLSQDDIEDVVQHYFVLRSYLPLRRGAYATLDEAQQLLEERKRLMSEAASTVQYMAASASTGSGIAAPALVPVGTLPANLVMVVNPKLKRISEIDQRLATIDYSSQRRRAAIAQTVDVIIRSACEMDRSDPLCGFDRDSRRMLELQIGQRLDMTLPYCNALDAARKGLAAMSKRPGVDLQALQMHDSQLAGQATAVVSQARVLCAGISLEDVAGEEGTIQLCDQWGNCKPSK